MSEAEWLTPKSSIDTRLRSLNPPWQIIPWREDLNLSALDAVAIEEFRTANYPTVYALFAGGKLLGIIEAKKVTVNPQNVLEQAKGYSDLASGAITELDAVVDDLKDIVESLEKEEGIDK